MGYINIMYKKLKHQNPSNQYKTHLKQFGFFDMIYVEYKTHLK
mgnify:CR=1 FL=1